jgi:organic radical activating enzyme
MLVKFVQDEDFVNYKKPSMFIGFPNCSFKCEKECGKKMCQNSKLATAPSIEVSYESIVERYLNNDITKAIVIGGLEPFDDFVQLFDLIGAFRSKTLDDIVIYTGYYPEEIPLKIYHMKSCYSNIIIKFGRYIPDKESIHDEILGVDLASSNQYAVRINYDDKTES